VYMKNKQELHWLNTSKQYKKRTVIQLCSLK
jgi:hypothetical protein